MHTTVTVDPKRPNNKNWFWNVMQTLSQFLAAAVFDANGDLTFSAHCGWWKVDNTPRKKHFYRFVNILFRDPQHCQNAWNAKT